MILPPKQRSAKMDTSSCYVYLERERERERVKVVYCLLFIARVTTFEEIFPERFSTYIFLRFRMNYRLFFVE